MSHRVIIVLPDDVWDLLGESKIGLGDVEAQRVEAKIHAGITRLVSQAKLRFRSLQACQIVKSEMEGMIVSVDSETIEPPAAAADPPAASEDPAAAKSPVEVVELSPEAVEALAAAGVVAG